MFNEIPAEENGVKIAVVYLVNSLVATGESESARRIKKRYGNCGDDEFAKLLDTLV